MSAIVPPLDLVPKLPAKGVSKFVTVFDKQTDRLTDQVLKVVQDATKLPSNLKCNDPNISKIKNQIEQIQKQITTIQELVPKVQKVVTTVKSLISVAQSIKLALTAAQLSNPVTAPVFIASQLMLIQDAVLVNAITSLSSLATIPATLPAKLAPLIPQLISAANIVSNACGNEEPPLNIPIIADNSDNGDNGDAGDNGYDGFGDRIDGIDAVTGYNDALETEFYTKVNVSEDDLNFRSDTIEQLLSQQRELLSSILEAPSKVYQASGGPVNTLGKLGDYYINLDDQSIYGPKLENNSWGQPVKY